MSHDGAPIALYAHRLFDGRTPTLTAGAYVVIESGIITDVTTSQPAGVDVVDLGDVTLMPGMIDAHVHLTWNSSATPETDADNTNPSALAIQTAKNAFTHLRHGVTSVRDTGSAGGHAITLGRAIESGDILGPRIVAAGRAIAMTGGHVWRHISREADGDNEILKAVRTEVRDGARCIKLMASGGILGDPDEQPGTPELNATELHTAVQEAHKLHRTVAAHAHSNLAIRNAVRAGVDSVEHASSLDDETAQLMREHGTVVVPTITAVTELLRQSNSLGIPDHVVAKAARARQSWAHSVRTAAANAVPCVTGTDAGVPGRVHGGLAAEAATLVELGYTEIEVLRGCTSRAATLLGISDKVGMVAPGYEADLVAVAGDPSQDIKALADVRSVTVQGRIFSKENLAYLNTVFDPQAGWS
ncbi:amidohydrolase family protein [Rhodococcus qingshengii]|uniref:metal-dependent hydrolase family protein n=1 Tax=Rhodococcus qingshengii TaxID=334542 RepID=UPI0010A5C449|nr:amidohydrolase family protein [Rhodococcus qingshengii]THJ65682.1 amidohydrolase family protein [Rhodococcus qingshengii]